jgi:hypothetical protein
MLTGLSNNSTVNNTTQYFPFTGAIAGSATDVTASTRIMMSRSGTVLNFIVRISAALAAGKTGTVTVFKNGIATTVAITLSVGPLIFSDNTHSFILVAGDEIGVQVVTTENVKFSGPQILLID